MSNTIFELAVNALSQGDFEKCSTYCKKILAAEPNNASVLQLLGIVALQQNDLKKAKEILNSAIKIDGSNAVFYVNLGEIHNREGNYSEAITCLKKSIELNPNFAGSKYNLANIYKKQKDYSTAINLYQQAIQLEPNNSQFQYNLANTLFEINNYDQALVFYNNVLQLDPNHSEANYNIGIILSNQNKKSTALEFFEKSLSQNPNNINTLKSIAVAYESQNNIDKAKLYYQKIINIDSNDLATKFHLKAIHPLVNLSNYEIDSYRNKLNNLINHESKEKLLFDVEKTQENLHPSSTLIYHGRNNKELKEKYASLFTGLFETNDSVNTLNNKYKIAFLVTKGHCGIFIKFMKNIINNLPNNSFDIYIIAPELEFNLKIKPFITNTNIKLLPLLDTLETNISKILQENFDLIYYWEVGSDPMNYFLPFNRLAKIQCTSLGWPETTGIPNMDYFISSNVLETNDSQNNYSEKLINFKNIPFNYDKPVFNGNEISLADLNIPNNKNLYLCVQNLKKIHPDFDDIIANILKKDKNGLILFVDDKYENITELIKTRIRVKYPEESDRVIFLPRFSLEGYYSLIKKAHVLLDTLYFGGGNTSYEGLAFGTPIITLPWDLQRGRFAYGCYKLMEIDDCIASDKEDYISKAINISNNKELRNSISQKILAKNNILFNNKSIVNEFVDFFLFNLKR